MFLLLRQIRFFIHVTYVEFGIINTFVLLETPLQTALLNFFQLLRRCIGTLYFYLEKKRFTDFPVSVTLLKNALPYSRSSRKLRVRTLPSVCTLNMMSL